MPPDLPPTVQLGLATCPGFIYALTAETAHHYRTPAWLLIGIEWAESGCDPYARNRTELEDSVGLLQLNRLGGQGTGWAANQLAIPAINLAIGTPPIAAAFHFARARGLDGRELVEAVCASSGHPRSDGVVTPVVKLLAGRALQVLQDPAGGWARWPTLP